MATLRKIREPEPSLLVGFPEFPLNLANTPRLVGTYA